MKKFVLKIFFLTISIVCISKIYGMNLVEQGFLPVFSEIKTLEDLKRSCEDFYRKKEEELLNSILETLNVSRIEFDKKVEESEKERKLGFEKHKTTSFFREQKEDEDKKRLRVIELFGYNPYEIIIKQLRDAGKNQENYIISALFSLDDPQEDDLTLDFYTGYYYSIYFPKRTFTSEEFNGAIAHEIQHIKNLDFSRKYVLCNLIFLSSNEKLTKEFEKFVFLTEVRSDILGSLKNISYAKGALSSFQKDLKALAGDEEDDDVHPPFTQRIEYLEALVKTMEMFG